VRGIEGGDAGRVTDLHLWAVAPGVYAAELVVVSPDPLGPDAYRRRLPASLGLGHVAVEVHRR
jgi:Co/Zn/Cd efflux system component